MFIASKWSRVGVVVVLSAASLFTFSTPARAASGEACVVTVVGETPDKTFILSPMTCYSSYDALLQAKGARTATKSTTPASVTSAQLAAASIIGTHYDGTSGTGASFSVEGSDCNGGGFNVSTVWNDRISSTANGCPRIFHYQNTNYAGSVAVTYSGLTNLPATLNNQTSSLKYFN